MGTLKIDCYCSEYQMDSIMNAVSGHLTNSDYPDISDFDDVIEGVRVCVGFEVFMDTVKIKVVEVLDSNWEVLPEDSAVLASRLRHFLEFHNRSQSEGISQAKQIRKDWIEYAHC